MGAAISMLVAEFVGKGTRPSALLQFPAEDARGNQYRNPSDYGYSAAPRLHSPSLSRADWARWQLRLGWILQSVLEKADIFKKHDSEVARLHACQGALFMAGYDLRCFDLVEG